MKAFVKTVWSWVRRKPTALSYIPIHRFGLMMTMPLLGAWKMDNGIALASIAT